MARNWEADAEPIPGYRLTRPLGKGGFGEVWEAIAPGEIRKAIKFVSTTAFSADMVGNASQELEGLAQMREIRHPFILSIERYEIVEDQLIIVTELADRNLDDRWRQCRSEGLAGIPRSELLGYLKEAAEALDLMNAEHKVQHLDIKPSNLFLVHNHIKVADFGLAKALEGFTTKVATGMTPIYAAPETFDGWATKTTDQYSLAIVYQELLTGTRPFPGPSARQFMLQHLTVEPDLSALPPADRDYLAIALSKTPKDRFPSCSKFIASLRELAGPESTPLDSAATEPVSSAEMTRRVAQSIALAAMTQDSSLLDPTLRSTAGEEAPLPRSTWICPIPKDERRLIANFRDIGTFPEWATELASFMVADPAPQLATVAEAISRHRQQAELLLTLTNHPVAKRNFRASNVPRALSTLGIPQACALLLISALIATKQWQAKLLADPLRLWWQERAAWTASLAYAIASSTDTWCPQTALVLGLIQDFGIGGMLRAYPKRYRLYLLRSRNMPDEHLAVNEMQWFGFSHADASAAILDLWGFSIEWLTHVSRHHRLGREGDYSRLLSLAESWADFLDGHHDARIPELVRSYKSIDRTLTQAISIDWPLARQKANELHELFGIPIPSDKKLSQIAYSMNAFK